MKFKEGDEVFCILSKDELEDITSKTSTFCGLDDEMLLCTDGSVMKVMAIGSKETHQSYLLSSPKFNEYNRWWFHEDDLEFAHQTLENE